MEFLELLSQLAMQLIYQTAIAGLMLIVVLLFIYRIVYRRRAEKRYSPLTENMLRMPAQSLEKDFEKFDNKLLIGMGAIFTPILILMITKNANLIAWVIMLPVSIGGVIFTSRALSEAMRLRLGIDGEQYTGLELNYLMRAGAWVYHDIPYQYGNIDHIVVSTGGVFAVETKTYRKPEGKRESTRQARVQFDGTTLTFPNFRTSEPVDQAQRHAKHLRQSIKRNLGINCQVTSVVALPGWYVERTARSDVWVINPKRGGALGAQVKKALISPEQAELISNYVESVARSVPAASKKMDPDASKYYDFWNNRRHEERSL